MFDISNRIKELRTDRGLTVNALANLGGISQSFLRDIELGNKKPTVEYLEYICDALKISLSAFFEDHSDKDSLSEVIGYLTPKQKEKLAAFIKAMI